MKIAHISDLHIGKVVHGYSMLSEQQLVLEQVVAYCKEEKIEVLIIAGDVYDRPVASGEAIKLFEKFLDQLVSLKVNVVIIGGNHDGYSRLAYGKQYFKHANIFIKADYETMYEKVSVNDVDFYLVNFMEPIHIKQITDENVQTFDEMMQIVNQEMENEINQDKTNVLIAHGYFAKLKRTDEFDYEKAGLQVSESERPLSIGTSDIVDISHFNKFDYIALGHLHQHQKINNAHYSGSIFPYSFSESAKKGIKVFDTETKDVDFVSFDLKRKLRTITGTFDEIMNRDDNETEDYMEIILTEEALIKNLMDLVKQKYPNTMLIRTKEQFGILEKSMSVEEMKAKDIGELFSDFCSNVYQEEVSIEDLSTFKTVVEDDNASS